MTSILAEIIQERCAHHMAPDPFENSVYRPIASIRAPQTKQAEMRGVLAEYLKRLGLDAIVKRGKLVVDGDEWLVRLSTQISNPHWAQLHHDGEHTNIVLVYLKPDAEYMWIVPRFVVDAHIEEMMGRIHNPHISVDIKKLPEWLNAYRVL